jgi:predicted metal-binding protein
MPYSVVSKKNGTTYYLHSKETESRGGKRVLYFFKKEVTNADGVVPLDTLPDGYEPTESSQTGLPLLTRKK